MRQRYTQAMHTQTLTQQSLTHVRSELTTLRATMTRQNIALASGGDAEKRYEEARDLGDAEARKARDEGRKRKRAEARIGMSRVLLLRVVTLMGITAELEQQLAIRSREVDEVKEGRTKDAQELLLNAKDRLAMLHTEVCKSCRIQSPLTLAAL